MSTTTAKPVAAGAGDFQPHGRPLPGPLDYLRKGLKAVASLQLTVVLFALSVGLIFFGTLAQRDSGIWTVVDKYFWSWVVWIPFDLMKQFGQVFLAEHFPKNTAPWTGSFPFPAGKLLGGLMLVNLLAAHLTRFRISWKRCGILLIHGGLMLLFVGEFVTREFAREQRMTIPEGQAVNYTESSRTVEIAFVDHSDAAADRVAVIPEAMLKKGGRIAHPDLPVDVEVTKYMVNTKLERAVPSKQNPATAGLGREWAAVERPEISGVDPNQEIDIPAAYLKLYKKGTDEVVGTYLAALKFYLLGQHDEVTIDGKPHELTMRFKRYYKPFSLHLIKFRFDRYPGTQKAKNFSSEVKVYDESGQLAREQTIRMNEPLRYEGETFYQSNFDKETEATTVLQVVRNPGWLIPYISCIMVGLGLVTHFGLMLGAFLTRRGGNPQPANGGTLVEAATPGLNNWQRAVPWLMLAVVGVYLLSVFGRMKPKGEFDYNALAQVPVLEGGRVKPLDSVARVYLRFISGQSVFYDHKGNEQPAIRWYMDTLAADPKKDADPAWEHKVIRVDNEQVLAELKLAPREGLRYSVNELRPHLRVIDEKAKLARQKRADKKTVELAETKMNEVAERLSLVMHIARGLGHDTDQNQFHLVPPQAAEEKWVSLGQLREDADAAAYSAAVTTARAKLRGRPGGFTRADEVQMVDRFVVRLSGGKPRGIDPAMRERLTDTFFVSDPAQHMPEMQGEILHDLLEDLPEADRVAVRAQEAATLNARLAANPAAADWGGLITAYRAKKYDDFNKQLAEYRATRFEHVAGKETANTKLEVMYNRFAPFLRCTGLYVMAFILTALGFVLRAAEKPLWGESLRKSATVVLVASLVLHTIALLTRMYLMDRPLVFVTNLYSSAVFIGWGCVGLGLVLEKLYPIGIGNVIASVLGLSTSIVAYNLATEDTLEMMQAVLDTNFWLATHVTTVTLGYTATFVAGFLGCVYVFQMLAAVVRDSFETPQPPTAGNLLAFGGAAAGLVAIPLLIAWPILTALAKFELMHSSIPELLFYFLLAAGGVYAIALLAHRAALDGTGTAKGGPVVPGIAQPLVGLALTPEVGKILGQMIYGVVCFATMLSFIGTVLGGIWADQSWGRFWGWDPKENGAVLIVLWNSLILHARWCGLVKTRGMAVLAVAGNIITAWSWFGTNQLEFGLHSYGRDTRLADGCANFWLGMLVIAGLGLIPQPYWASAVGRVSAAAGGKTAKADRRR